MGTNRGGNGKQRGKRQSPTIFWSSAIFFATILLVFTSSLLMNTMPNNTPTPPPTDPLALPNRMPHTGGLSHAPIHISGDGDFTAGNGVVQGMGYPGDPFVIANWTIYGQPKAAAISIIGTHAYFVIRNCTVVGAAYGDEVLGATAYGIDLGGGNGTIEHNAITSTGRVNYGIYLNGATDCIIRENEFYQTSSGIGILYGTTRVTVTGNFFHDNDGGIIFIDCWGANSVTGNLLVNNGGYIAINSASGFTLVTGNTCTSNSSRSQDAWYGISVYESNHTTVLGNNCSFLHNGIQAERAYNTTITGNTCEDNAEYGVRLSHCTLTEVARNFFARNRLGCILDEGGAQNNIHDNTCNPDEMTWIWVGILAAGTVSTVILLRRYGIPRKRKEKEGKN